MKTLVDWVLARRERLVILAIVFASMTLLWVSGALIALDTARRGAAQGALAAALVLAGLLALVIVSGSDWRLFALIGGVMAATGVVAGALLNWARNLVLAFQGAVLAGFVAGVALTVLPAPRGILAPTIAAFVSWLIEGGASEEQVAVLREVLPQGLLNVTVHSLLLVPVLLAYWWLTWAEDRPTFAVEFRALRLGRALGVPATVVFLASLVTAAELVQNLAVLVLIAFLLQGLAVLHALFSARRWHGGWLVPLYALFVTPLLPFMVLGVGGIGLVDNWFNLRARFRSRTDER